MTSFQVWEKCTHILLNFLFSTSPVPSSFLPRFQTILLIFLCIYSTFFLKSSWKHGLQTGQSTWNAFWPVQNRMQILFLTIWKEHLFFCNSMLCLSFFSSHNTADSYSNHDQSQWRFFSHLVFLSQLPTHPVPVLLNNMAFMSVKISVFF